MLSPAAQYEADRAKVRDLLQSQESLKLSRLDAYFVRSGLKLAGEPTEDISIQIVDLGEKIARRETQIRMLTDETRLRYLTQGEDNA